MMREARLLSPFSYTGFAAARQVAGFQFTFVFHYFDTPPYSVSRQPLRAGAPVAAIIFLRDSYAPADAASRQYSR